MDGNGYVRDTEYPGLGLVHHLMGVFFGHVWIGAFTWGPILSWCRSSEVTWLLVLYLSSL